MLVCARWVHFAAVFVLFGSAAFRLILPRELASTTAIARSSRTLTVLVRFGAWIAAASGVGWIALTLIDMVGSAASLDAETTRAFFLDTSFGSIELARLVLFLALLAATTLPLAADRRLAILGAASGVLLVTQAWLGHAAEGGATPLGLAMLAAYAVHVLAAAVWLGGLVPLLLVVRELRRMPASQAAMLALLSRVSSAATIAVSLIIASGIANTAFRVGDHLSLLAASSYGRVLGTKLGLVALMLACGAYNRFVAIPRMREPPAPRPARRLAISLGLELTAGALVLAAAAVLGATPPPM